MNTTSENKIKSGYQKTPIGTIPKDWEVKRIGSISKTFSGGTPRTGVKEYYENGTIPFIKSGEIYRDSTNQKITDLGLKESSAKLVEKGDLLYALYGANSGEVSISKQDGAINQAVLCIKSKINNKYLEENLTYSHQRIISKYLQGGQGNLSAKILKSVQLPIPPLPEQERIASCLTTWDKGIEKLSALIEAKKQQKKGLMQQLLTGEKRLDGFTEEWKEVKLGELGKFRSGSGFPIAEQGGTVGIPFYKVSDMNLKGNESQMSLSNNYVNASQIERMKLSPIKEHSIIFAKVGAAIFLERKRKAIDFLIDNNMMAFTPYNFNDFIKYIFDKIRLSKYAQVGALPSYNASDLKTLKVDLPSINEQTAIAEVLTKIDEEIELLEKKLDQFKTQKKGLMQVLLTGKKRLV